MKLDNSISIIIPLYNKESSIIDCIKSILDQSVSNIEIVIVDDGSTDKSLQIVEGIESPIIRIYSQKNQGPASARNYGVKNAKGDWCLFLDADDILLDDSLKKMDNLISNHKGYNVFVCNYYSRYDEECTLRSIYEKGEVKNNYYEYFKGRIPVRVGSTIYRKSVLEKHPQKSYLRRYEDLESILDMMREEKIFRETFPVMIYNQDLSSASKKHDNIEMDFLGHLSFSGKSFWEKAILYSLYEQALLLYPDEAKSLYSTQIRRMPLLRLYFFLIHIKAKLLSLRK